MIIKNIKQLKRFYTFTINLDIIFFLILLGLIGPNKPKIVLISACLSLKYKKN